MALEELDDIAEELADKLGIYGEERSYWTADFKRRVRAAVESEQKLAPTKTCCECKQEGIYAFEDKSYCPQHAHNLTHSQPLCPPLIACPVVNGNTKELIPWGVYPNGDWS